ncbi:MAG: hypothetical protein QOE36_1591 [Gaiellaceae bacterium]|nr:hypothetical protein [Gaiellaceae bacterium]
MQRRFRPRLSYANVTATLALVLAVAGTSYAATQINGKNLKNRSVAAKKLKKNTLTGTEIKESKLGTVPHATQADNAATADTAAGATSAANAVKFGGATPESYRLSCPSGTILVLGECFETNLRAANTFRLATKECGAAGRRVPTFGELEGARQNGFTVGVPPNNYELTASVDSSNTVVAIDPSGNVLDVMFSDPTLRPFRCIALPTNTG